MRIIYSKEKMIKYKIITDDSERIWKRFYKHVLPLLDLVRDSIESLKKDAILSEPLRILAVIPPCKEDLNQILKDTRAILNENKWKIPFLTRRLEVLIGLIDLIYRIITEELKLENDPRHNDPQYRGDFEGDNLTKILGHLIEYILQFFERLTNEIKPYFNS